MDNIKVVICDDEKIHRSLLTGYLQKLFENMGKSSEIEEFAAGADLLRAMEQIEPDIIFLDIQMKDMDGIETARKIRRLDRDAVIVFISSFTDYVFDSFEVRPFNYLVKPIEQNRFNVVCRKAIQEVERLEEKKTTYIYIKIGNEQLKFKTEDVYYFESEARKIRLVSKEGEVKFFAKMSNLEKELNVDGFLRCHHGYLANIGNARAIHGDLLEMENGDRIPIGRTRKEDTRIAFFESVRMVSL